MQFVDLSQDRTRVITILRLALLLAACVPWLKDASAEQNCLPDRIEPTAAASRFIDDGEGTVTDTGTALQWKRCAEGQVWDGRGCTGAAASFTWRQALELADSAIYAGVSDWRLPNIKELASIVEKACSSAAIDLSVFPDTPPSTFWSASPTAYEPGQPWNLFFGSGDMAHSDAGAPAHVRLLRAGVADGCEPFCGQIISSDDFLYQVIGQAPGTYNDVMLVDDIDQDGDLDLIVGGKQGSDNFAWYEAPSWQRHIIGELQHAEAGGDTGDIDGDGRIDLLVGQERLHNGLYWFRAPEDPRQRWTRFLITDDYEKYHDQLIADIDRDGAPEVLSFSQNSGKLFYYDIPPNVSQLGTDQEWPASHRTVIDEDAAQDQEGLVIADVNSDGYVDVIGGYRWYKAEPAPSLQWSRRTIAADYSTTRAAVGDIDGDGRLDIVLSEGDVAQDAKLAWFEQTGDADEPDFVEHRLLSDLSDPHTLALEDLDRDGDLDILVAEMELRAWSEKRMIVFENRGMGTFDQRLIDSDHGTHNAVVGDIGNDGDLDIVGKPYGTDQRIDLWENVGTTRRLRFEFSIVELDTARPYRGHFILPADIDGDGRVDVATGRWWYRNPTWTRYEVPEIGQITHVFDFDHDGDLDLLGTTGIASADFVWMEQTDSLSGAWLAHPLGQGNGDWVHGAVTADIVGGGDPEFVLTYHDGQDGSNGIEYFELPADPTQPWTRVELDPFSFGEGLDAGDIDRDGDLDIAAGPTWFEAQGGSWIRHDVVSGFTPDRVRIADINGDARSDIVFTEDLEQEGQERVVWLQAPSDPASGTWTAHVISGPGGPLAKLSRPLSLDLADMDRDGDIDILTGEHAGSKRLIIYENGGGGSSWSERIIASGHEHHVGTQVFDFDRDGDLDIVSHGYTDSDFVRLWENTGL